MAGFGTELSIETRQTMKLTPAQLQTIEILQLNAVQLEERINNELMENPVLEIADGQQTDVSELPDRTSFELHENTFESANFDDTPQFDRYDDHDYWELNGHAQGQSGAMNGSAGTAEFEKYYRAETTLTDHLMSQLHAISCPDNVRRACRFVIYSLDKNGFLDMDPDELEAASENTAEEFRQAIPIVQSMEPAGIGARNLEECLCLQIDPDNELAEDARRTIGMLSEISAGNLRAVIKKLGISRDRLMQVLDLIRSLDPRPGARFSDGSAQKYIAADVIADVNNDQVTIYMAGSIPRLCLSRYYTDLAASTRDAEVRKYLKDRIDRANGLISNIEQRSSTIVNVTRIILEHQSHYLEPGSHTLRPLTMQEVADELGINVSTVSRAVSGKYLKCPGGTYALRHFFTAEVAGGTRDSILSRIRELIDKEDPEHPLSDQKITDILIAEGTDISRRAVAKYRDEGGILKAAQRKKRF